MPPDPAEALHLADRRDLIETIAEAVRLPPPSRRRRSDARFERLAALVAAEQIADHLARSRFVVMQRPATTPLDASRPLAQQGLLLD